MSQELKVTIDSDGVIKRVGDDKHLATVDPETGEVKYENPAYAKGDYKEKIRDIANDFITNGSSPAVSDPEPLPDLDDTREIVSSLIPSEEPPRHPTLGSFSSAHINYDHANLSDEDFSKKYSVTSECQLEFIALKPDLFADIAGLEARFAKLSAAK